VIAVLTLAADVLLVKPGAVVDNLSVLRTVRLMRTADQKMAGIGAKN
jgi:hypothetical protein